MTELDGKPDGAPAYYEGQERFSDGQFVAVEDWTAELALRACRADDFAAGSPERVSRIRDAIDEGLLPEPAVDALIAAGEISE